MVPNHSNEFQPVEKRIDIQAGVCELHIVFKLLYLLRKLMLTECNKWRHVSQQILIFQAGIKWRKKVTNWLLKKFGGASNSPTNPIFSQCQDTFFSSGRLKRSSTWIHVIPQKLQNFVISSAVKWDQLACQNSWNRLKMTEQSDF